MKKATKNKPIELILLLLIFICTLIMTCSVFPKQDEYIYNSSIPWNFDSIMSYTLSYGNGRLLGNLICIFFSHFYQYKFILISLTVTVLSFLMYKLFFPDKPLFLIPVSFLIFYPSQSMYNVVFMDFPSFTNYVIPIALIAAVLLIMKNFKSGNHKWAKILLLALCTITACLFSENTTIIIALMAVFFLVSELFINKKLSTDKTAMFVSAIIGSLIMLVIPRITDVSDKLTGYRAMTFSPSDIFGNLLLTADIINDLIFVFIILSCSLSYIAIKNHKLNMCDWICVSVLFLYTIFSLSVSNMKDSAFNRLLILLSTIIYVAAVVILTLKFVRKAVKYYSVVLILLSIASAMQMVFINILSERTFYITHYLLLLLALMYLSEALCGMKVKICSSQLKRALTVAMTCFLIVFSVMQCENTIRNFDVYVIKNENEKNSTTETFEEKFGSGFNPEIITYALDNKEYYNPSESVIWPQESWLDVLRESVIR